MNELDAKDFRILDEIYRTNGVTAASEKIGLSQPSMSIRLSKMRKHFHDALFVRTAAGMQPTPHMESLLPAIRAALALFDGNAAKVEPFDQVKSTRIFRICMTDSGQSVILPRLFDYLQHSAPNVHIETSSLGRNTARLLESGEVDTAIGFTLDIPLPFYAQTLFSESFVCMVSQRHPRLKDGLTKKQFIEEQHVEVLTPRGTGHWILGKALEDQGINRNVCIRIPSFLGLAEIVATSNLIAIVPVHLGRIFAADGRVRLLNPPMQLPTYAVKQYWHERYHRDPANMWFRNIMAEIFTE